jgi:deoxyribonucleoside regulator
MFIGSPVRDTTERLRFLHTVASLYHLEGKTQAEIAEMLKVSRSKVLRALHEARAVGIVQISVVDPSRTDEALANDLERELGLTRVVVVAGHPEDPAFTRRRVGHAAATLLDEILPDDAALGLGWGRTLYEVTQAIEPRRRRNLRIVPLMGGLGQVAPSFQVHEMARVCSERFGGTWSPFFLPAIVESKETYAALMTSADVAQVIDAWSSLDVALFGIGNIDLGRELQMLFATYLNDASKERMRRAGVVGDICMRFYRADGSCVEDALQYVVSIDLDRLRQVPTKIAVASGAEKAAAILGAVHGGYVDTLITDVTAAREMLRLSQVQFQEASR